MIVINVMKIRVIDTIMIMIIVINLVIVIIQL